MKRFRWIALAAVVCFLCLGCQPARKPRHLIILPDTSASIDRDARQQMFADIAQLATHLHRGDSLTIVPITGNADAELPGRILHYQVPPGEQRQAYDADLRKLSDRIRGDLARLASSADAHPGQHTDILGTLRVALSQIGPNADTELIVLSDFIQDDGEIDFAHDPRLSSTSSAEVFGKCARSQLSIRVGTHVSLVRLSSSEYAALPKERQRAINAFWLTCWNVVPLTSAQARHSRP